MNVATEPTKPDRPVTLERFDFGTEKESAAQITHPTDLGCVDWYLYRIERTPDQRWRNVFRDLPGTRNA